MSKETLVRIMQPEEREKALLRLFKAITEAINSARPEENTEDMDAIIPAGVWREVVDAHARFLYERNNATREPCDSESNVGTAQVKQE